MRKNLPSIQPRTNPIRVGFVPLVDAAALVLATEEGFFEKEGITVDLVREPGWASIRDKITYGELEAAHSPVGLCFGISWGIGVTARPCQTGFLFNSNGDAITVSKALANAGVSEARDLLNYETDKPPTFGIPNQLSSHRFLLRQWLLGGGVGPQDVVLRVLPPALMVDALASNLIQGFCVGEPYNTLAVKKGLGVVVKESADLSPNHPEKALLVTNDFARNRRDEHLALIRALHAASEVCETADGRERAAELLSHRRYLDLDRSIIRESLFPANSIFHNEDFHQFSTEEVNAPISAKASWVVSHIKQAGLLDASAKNLKISKIFREDIYHEALSTTPSHNKKLIASLSE